MAQGKTDNRRLYAVGALLALGFVATGVLQSWVQLVGRGEILGLATKSRRYQVPRVEYARRGTVYSSDGAILAQSEDAYELGIDYRRVPRSPGFFMALAEASGLPEPELSQPGYLGLRSRLWRRSLSSEQARRVSQVKSEWDADGVSLSRALRRDYPLMEAASGFVGRVKDGRPLSGLELSKNAILAGRDGFSEGFVDRTGVFLQSGGRRKPRVNGDSITLTIDSRLQVVATQAVRAAVEAHNAQSGVAIILDPRNGDLLAMASWPSFNPDEPLGAQSDRNPAYMCAFEPGSTFKVLTLAKALDTGAVKPTDHVYCAGELAITKSKKVRCDAHHGKRAHGDINLEQAIGKSCNVSAAIWAMRAGWTPMVQFLEQTGLLEKTKLGLPSESSGLFNRNDPSRRLQIATVGFGQSLTVTPVALAGAFGMLGNKGVQMRPRIVRAIGGKEMPPESMGAIVRPETATEVLRLMESVIEQDYGTGADLRIPGYRLAGKTGTAQKTNPKTGRVGGAGYVANFVGFVPSQNPRAVVLVMIDNPKGVYYGGRVAGPVFQELAKALIRYYSIPPDAVRNAPVVKVAVNNATP